MNFGWHGTTAPQNGKRVVVAGGAGFIGSQLCARLVQSGCSVLAIDNLATGNLRNIVSLFGVNGFHFVQYDIASPAALRADWIFNTTCSASPQHARLDPEPVVETHTDGVLNLLREAHACNARFLQTLDGVTDEPADAATQRDAYRGMLDADWQRACFGEGGRFVEGMCLEFHRTRHLDVKIARLFDVYGPHMQLAGGGVISRFIVQALNNQPMVVRGTEGQTRTFCYVDDLVDGIVRLMAAPRSLTGPLELGGSTPIAIAELAQRIITLTGSRSRIVRQPARSGHQHRHGPDTSLARAALDWSPHVSLDVGLARTIQWFDGVLRDAQPSRPAPRSSPLHAERG